jgi:hypothetical protein
MIRASEIHSGERTQSQDQVMTPQSFKTMKAIVSSPVNPIPLLLVLLFLFSIVVSPFLFSGLSITCFTRLVKYFFKIFLAPHQTQITPPQDALLIAGSADLECFALRADSVALVYIVDTATKPHAAVSAIGFNRFNCFAGVRCFDALCGYLPACFILDFVAFFESDAIVFGELADSADVNHFGAFLSLSDASIAFPGKFVKRFFQNFSKIFSPRVDVSQKPAAAPNSGRPTKKKSGQAVLSTLTAQP